jgi:hypothetical protein
MATYLAAYESYLNVADLHGLEAVRCRVTIAAKARFRYLGGIKRMRP